MKKMSIWNKTQIIVKVFVSVLLIKIMFDIVDFDSTLILLKKMNLIFFLMALVVMAIGIFITNLRWQVILNHLGVSIKFFMLLKYLLIGFFFNQTLPSSIGGDAFRGYYLHKTGNNIKNSTLGVLIDRLFGFIGLFVLALLVAPFLFNRFLIGLFLPIGDINSISNLSLPLKNFILTPIFLSIIVLDIFVIGYKSLRKFVPRSISLTIMPIW